MIFSFRHILPLISLAIFSGCESSGVDEENRDDASACALTFSANSAEETRATELSATSKAFLVNTSYNADGSSDPTVVMDRYEVRWDAKKNWYYDGLYAQTENAQTLQYWNTSATSYTFAALSPVPADKTCFVTSADGKITATNLAGGSDWMVARTVRKNETTVTDEDGLSANYQFHTDDAGQPTNVVEALTSTVPLNFHHLMANVEIKVFCEVDEGKDAIKLREFKIETEKGDPANSIAADLIRTVGTYTETTTGATAWSDLACWTYPTNGDDISTTTLCSLSFTEREAVEIGKTSSSPTTMFASTLIPHSWADPAGRKLTVTAMTTEGIIISGSFTLTAANNGSNSWNPNTIYTYTLKLPLTEPDAVILFGVTVDDWTKGEQHNQTVTNW